MRVRFQADYDLKFSIVRGVKRRAPLVDFQTAEQAQLRGVLDDAVLARAADEQRILVSHDHQTMPNHFAEFIRTRESAGVILITQRLPIVEAINDLVLIFEASEAEEWVNRLDFIPL